MTTPESQSESALTAIAALRTATDDLHQGLHEHPLVVGLFAKPSMDGYRAFLRGLLSFYRSVEPELVQSCRRCGAVRQYARSVRTERLIADLTALDVRIDLFDPGDERVAPPRLGHLGELTGCLYVIKGSALGGPSVLRRISGRLPLNNASRFFRGDGAATRRTWAAFQAFCERTCRAERPRRAAIRTARQTFEQLADCLTRVQASGSDDSGRFIAGRN